VGLISGLVLLPLAPVRGVVWVAEQLEEEALRTLHDPATIQARLDELDALREQGLVSEEEARATEDELVRRLLGGGGDG
jgi:cytochrome c-type biogenesis protein CcmH/NrfG